MKLFRRSDIASLARERRSRTSETVEVVIGEGEEEEGDAEGGDRGEGGGEEGEEDIATEKNVGASQPSSGAKSCV